MGAADVAIGLEVAIELEVAIGVDVAVLGDVAGVLGVVRVADAEAETLAEVDDETLGFGVGGDESNMGGDAGRALPVTDGVSVRVMPTKVSTPASGSHADFPSQSASVSPCATVPVDQFQENPSAELVGTPLIDVTTPLALKS